MAPNNVNTYRPIIIWPLPLWVMWQLVLLIAWAGRLAFGQLCAASSKPYVQPARHQDGDCEAIAERLHTHLNDYRKAKNLRPLAWNERLELSSLYQSTRMSELGEFEHVLSDGVTLGGRVDRAGYRYAACGENLFWLHHPRTSIAALAWAIHDGWVKSPAHQKNLVGDWVEVGIGVVPDGEGGFYATQNFGKPPAPW